MEKSNVLGGQIQTSLQDVEKVRKITGEVIKQAPELVFGKSKNTAKIDELKKKYPKMDFQDMPNERISQIYDATKSKKEVIHETFDQSKNSGAVRKFVDDKQRQGYAVIDSRVIGKTTHVVICK